MCLAGKFSGLVVTRSVTQPPKCKKKKQKTKKEIALVATCSVAQLKKCKIQQKQNKKQKIDGMLKFVKSSVLFQAKVVNTQKKTGIMYQRFQRHRCQENVVQGEPSRQEHHLYHYKFHEEIKGKYCPLLMKNHVLLPTVIWIKSWRMSTQRICKGILKHLTEYCQTECCKGLCNCKGNTEKIEFCAELQ